MSLSVVQHIFSAKHSEKHLKCIISFNLIKYQEWNDGYFSEVIKDIGVRNHL